ncbi:MAG: hypothetical protein UU82_C0017G0004 [Candidatus Nomurabacteria bacterium GW2011_GWC2_41_8]|uniref:Uncharacterized protein n=2 Tax=Candidatus Nomuraibacteriota TaxID=1752729 RepID=A0A1F6YDZ1_9BACT|nr:MAG: hypothetical protein UU82_C0017G0004 [Candidatus Nomurabacteria bacterium GW2011_GWC2_41_8]OGI80415.1 MAG: hypothetical protein A3D43_00050 [Candidatus Nomurabacteria bacterium RIFCSPHIGHO2_02_FULL_41_52]OGI85097.1 MAG: hypothetical protein A3F49_01540 [Candidatus Nomurabacteria bacterium RIFCSPHIGHO2_12_FULL_42_19]OGI94039.1 MAG: hypothetical protein A3A07_01855 [Candidatus Nomurabacteria bacterium RIFCSPLOWO2_01_FULL_41_52]OGI98702.1 MAG: hypothetical protein A3H56_02280 [Candidatus N
MTKNNFISVASYVFLIVGIMHIARLLTGWQVQINGFMIPMWIYWVEAFASLYLSFLGFRLSKKA